MQQKIAITHEFSSHGGGRDMIGALLPNTVLGYKANAFNKIRGPELIVNIRTKIGWVDQRHIYMRLNIVVYLHISSEKKKLLTCAQVKLIY
jgi:hypothetical protein